MGSTAHGVWKNRKLVVDWGERAITANSSGSRLVYRHDAGSSFAKWPQSSSTSMQFWLPVHLLNPFPIIGIPMFECYSKSRHQEFMQFLHEVGYRGSSDMFGVLRAIAHCPPGFGSLKLVALLRLQEASTRRTCLLFDLSDLRDDSWLCWMTFVKLIVLVVIPSRTIISLWHCQEYRKETSTCGCRLVEYSWSLLQGCILFWLVLVESQLRRSLGGCLPVFRGQACFDH